MSQLLRITNLSVTIASRFGDLVAVDDVSLDVEAGQLHGVVGESGAGKSTIGTAIMGLLESPAYISSGSIALNGQELTQLSQQEHHKLRGKRISMIFQDPQTSLNPLLKVSDQLIETIQQHNELNYHGARQMAIELLEETGIHNSELRIDDYPHQFSGGMRQRVVIALALCSRPDLIIADEPTTALDVSVQKQILNLIRQLAKQRGVGIILITHDIGVIAEICDVVTVLRYGRLVEHGTTAKVLGHPDALYTQQLMAAVPRLEHRLERFTNIASEDPRPQGEETWQVDGATSEIATQWLLQARHETSVTEPKRHAQAGKLPSPPSDSILSVSKLCVEFGAKRPLFGKTAGFKALDNIDIELARGTVLGVVGESGSGKSTLAKAIVGLVPCLSGTMQYQGQDLPDARKRSRKHPSRRSIQMIFQDPYSSLNNRRTVEAILKESLRFYGSVNTRLQERQLIASVLERVGLPHRALRKYPHQFSGGQRQRIAIARALMARPEFLICDEPTSALDVSVQAHVLNLLKDLQQSLGLSILFISHDLAVVRQMADTIMVLRQGQQVETGDSEPFFQAPTTDYARKLLRETPSLSLLTT